MRGFVGSAVYNKFSVAGGNAYMWKLAKIPLFGRDPVIAVRLPRQQYVYMRTRSSSDHARWFSWEEMLKTPMDNSIFGPLMAAVTELRSCGVFVPLEWGRGGMPVLIAEALNWAAKTKNGDLYRLKAKVIDFVSTLPGVESGWTEDGETFALFHPDVGTCHFHDPYDEIESGGEWDYPWTGVRRQELAFKILASRDMQRMMSRITGKEASRVAEARRRIKADRKREQWMRNDKNPAFIRFELLGLLRRTISRTFKKGTDFDVRFGRELARELVEKLKNQRKTGYRKMLP